MSANTVQKSLSTPEAIKEVLRDADRPLKGKEIAEMVDRPYSTVRGALRTLFDKDEILALNDQTYVWPGRFLEPEARLGVQPKGGWHEREEGERSPPRKEVRKVQSNTPPLLVIEMGGQRIEIGLYMRTPEIPISVPGRTFTVDVERETDLFFDTDADKGHEDT